MSFSLSEWTQIIVAIGTAVAAIAATITTFQNKKVSKQMESERHLMIKPQFIVQSVFEKRIERNIDLEVINIGFNKLMNLVNVAWDGTSEVNLDIINRIEDNEKNRGVRIRLDFLNVDEKRINGKLFLIYKDLLGKEYKEYIPIEIIYNYENEHEGGLPILKGVNGEVFR